MRRFIHNVTGGVLFLLLIFTLVGVSVAIGASAADKFWYYCLAAMSITGTKAYLMFAGGVCVAIFLIFLISFPRKKKFSESECQCKSAPVAAKIAAIGGEKDRKLSRSEALTLLSALQRESRFLDFLKEPIAGYKDEQIGAAVRDIHRDCAAALDRILAIQPLIDQPEGSTIVVPEGFNPNMYKLTGQIMGHPPYRGQLCHHGWKATKCDLPEWSGQPDVAMVVAPAEVHIP